jgi:hypothetical protein
MLFPYCQGQHFTPIQNYRQNYSLNILMFVFFKQQTRRQKD